MSRATPRPFAVSGLAPAVLSSLIVVGGCGHQGTAAPEAAPSDPHSAAPAVAVPPPATAAETAPTQTTPAPASSAAWSAFGMPSNCQAKLAIAEEVTRLLAKAAAHATRSQACVDGPGVRVAATDILACPAPPDGGDQIVSVYYRLARYPEGDTRGCGTDRDCSDAGPLATEHRAQLRFESNAQGQLRMRVPEVVPGMGPDATPLHAVHDGACYGKSTAFIAEWVKP